MTTDWDITRPEAYSLVQELKLKAGLGAALADGRPALYNDYLWLSRKETMMPRFAGLFSFLAVVGFTLALNGCGNQAELPPSQPAGQQEGNSADEHGHGEHAAHEGHGEYEEALSQLSEADRALAEKQKTCPVSGEPLGAMGKPYKVTVKGQEVLLCCQGCENTIKENPDEYLAKLNK